MSITEIESGAEASAKVLNDNFKYLDEAITASFTTLENRVNSTTSNISNISSNLSTIQGSISTLEEASNSKASKDLSDVTPADSFIESVLEYFSPDYSAGYSVSSEWTATQSGWLYVRGATSSSNSTAYAKVDDKYVYYNYQSGANRNHHEIGATVFISKGQVLSASNLQTIVFYPCKGG